MNRGRHTLKMRTNGTRHNIPNTIHLREREGRKERGFKKYITKWERLEPLNLLNIAAWLITTCLRLRPFCLSLEDHALALCVLAPCVYIQRQRQEPADKQWKENMQRAYERGIKQISMIDMVSKKTRKQANK